jgi:hypothetical protein
MMKLNRPANRMRNRTISKDLTSMPEPPTRRTPPAPSRLDPFLGPVVAGLLLGFCVLYWGQAISFSASWPLQTDDAFTLWMIKSKSIIAALKLGADTAPPAFYYLMKANCRIFGFGYLGLRLPALLGMFVFSAGIFFMLRKYVSNALAGAAAIVPLFGTMGQVGYFARPPALMMASFSLMCLVWTSDSTAKPKAWRSVALAALLGFAISMHFYSVLFVPVLAIMELAYAIETRTLRKGHWIGIIAGACVLLLWLPVIGPIYRMTRGSAKSPLYYAHPTVLNLIKYISSIAFDKDMVVVLIVFMFLGAIYRWRQISRREAPPQPVVVADHLGIVGFAAGTIPFLTYAFAAVVTHVFNERYFVSAALGLGIALALFVRSLRWSRTMDMLLLLVVVGVYARAEIPVITHHVKTVSPFEVAIHDLPGNDPVALPDGGSFFGAQECVDPVVRARTVYLFLPNGLQDPDTEPARIAHAWHTLRPELPIFTAEDFFAQHKSFYILTWGTPGVGLTPWVTAHMHTQIAAANGDYTILHVTSD